MLENPVKHLVPDDFIVGKNPNDRDNQQETEGLNI